MIVLVGLRVEQPTPVAPNQALAPDQLEEVAAPLDLLRFTGAREFFEGPARSVSSILECLYLSMKSVACARKPAGVTTVLT